MQDADVLRVEERERPLSQGALVPSSSPARMETSCPVTCKSLEEERGIELAL